MKDERIEKGFDSLEMDDGAKQRIRSALLEERARMLEQDATDLRTDSKAADGTGSVPNSVPVRRVSRIRAFKIVSGVAACLLVAAGIGMLVVPRLGGFLDYRSGLSSNAAATSATRSDAAESYDSDKAVVGASTANGIAASDVSTMSAAEADEESNVTNESGAGAASFALDGIGYRRATAEEAAAAGLKLPIDPALLGESIGTVSVTEVSGEAVNASACTVAEVPRAQMVAIRYEGQTDWQLFVAA